MLSEPLLAHPAEFRAHATWHPHPGDDADRDHHDADADDEEHMVVAAISRLAIVTRAERGVCALVHNASGPCTREQLKPVIAILWVSAAFVIGLAGRLDSFTSWTVLTGVGVVPSLVMM